MTSFLSKHSTTLGNLCGSPSSHQWSYSTSRSDSPLTRETSASTVGGRKGNAVGLGQGRNHKKVDHPEEHITAQEMSSIIRLLKRNPPASDNFGLIDFVT